MILLSDNDILLKLALCDLLDQALVALSSGYTEVFVLGTARFRLGIAKNQKKTKARIGEAAFARLESFFEQVQVLDEPSAADLLLFDDIVGIDPGEAALFSATGQFTDYFLATGDKTSLKALSASPVCQELCARLAGKVICLEQIIARLVERYGFTPVLNKIVPARSCDSALRAIFGSGLDATEENVRAGLSAYIDDLRKNTGLLLSG